MLSISLGVHAIEIVSIVHMYVCEYIHRVCTCIIIVCKDCIMHLCLSVRTHTCTACMCSYQYRKASYIVHGTCTCTCMSTDAIILTIDRTCVHALPTDPGQ